MQSGIVPKPLSIMRADDGYGEKRKINYCNPYSIGRQAIVTIYRVKRKDNAAYRDDLRVIAERTMRTLKDPRPLGPLSQKESKAFCQGMMGRLLVPTQVPHRVTLS